jgi:hypothetical protein
MMKPNYIAFYWVGSKLPKWRLECVSRLREIYHDAQYISIYNPKPCDRIIENSNAWRLEQASKYKNFLWVDNDIYLDNHLELPDGPGMADEYRCNHWSIIWSGNNPDFFKGKMNRDLAYDKIISPIKISGIHYAHDKQGNRRMRRY